MTEIIDALIIFVNNNHDFFIPVFFLFKVSVIVLQQYLCMLMIYSAFINSIIV